MGLQLAAENVDMGERKMAVQSRLESEANTFVERMMTRKLTHRTGYDSPTKMSGGYRLGDTSGPVKILVLPVHPNPNCLSKPSPTECAVASVADMVRMHTASFCDLKHNMHEAF